MTWRSGYLNVARHPSLVGVVDTLVNRVQRQLHTIVELQLAQHVLHMILHCPVGHEKFFGDLTIGRPLGDATQHIDFAGGRWRQQVLAVLELTERGGKRQEPLSADGPWQRLVDTVESCPGTAIISMEFLAPRRNVKIDLIKEAFADADLQVVLTARDLARSLPAMWTESMQNRGVRTWDQFLDAVRTEDMSQKPGRWFWKHQRISAIAERWSTAVGHDHFTLVTVPPKDAPSDVLWQRFAAAAEIPDGLCVTEVRSNPGLDAASALVLRELNERLAAESFNRWDYDSVVKSALAKQGLVTRGRDKVPLGMDERWVRRASKEEVHKLRGLGLRVIGDLDDLESRPVPGVHTKKVSAQHQLEAALDGLAFLTQAQMRRSQAARARTASASLPSLAAEEDDE